MLILIVIDGYYANLHLHRGAKVKLRIFPLNQLVCEAKLHFAMASKKLNHLDIRGKKVLKDFQSTATIQVILELRIAFAHLDID